MFQHLERLARFNIFLNLSQLSKRKIYYCIFSLLGRRRMGKQRRDPVAAWAGGTSVSRRSCVWAGEAGEARGQERCNEHHSPDDRGWWRDARGRQPRTVVRLQRTRTPAMVRGADSRGQRRCVDAGGRASATSAWGSMVRAVPRGCERGGGLRR
jgi:hypothetical protein